MKLDADHNKRLAELRELSRVYAKAKADEVYLTHFRKSKLASLTAHYFTEGSGSHASAETKARCHPDYLNVLEGLREATEVSSQAYWELRIAENAIGLLRSKMAHEREEMKLT